MTVRSAHYYDHDLHVCECGCITVRTMRGFGKIQRWDSGSDRGGTGPSCGAGQHLVILTWFEQSNPYFTAHLRPFWQTLIVEALPVPSRVHSWQGDPGHFAARS